VVVVNSMEESVADSIPSRKVVLSILPRGTVVEPMAAYNASPSAIKTLTSTCEIGTRSLKCAVRCPRGSLLKAPAPSGPAPDEPFLITIARGRAGYVPSSMPRASPSATTQPTLSRAPAAGS
jgi:hypothetical protein